MNILYSLLLGLLAWGFAILAIKVSHARKLLVLGSFTACCGSVLMALLNLRHLAEMEDWSAIMDTMGALTIGLVVMMVVTLLLNTLALLLKPRPKQKKEEKREEKKAAVE